MVVRIIVTLMLVILGAGFIFFVGNVLWLGTREFFKVYGPQSKALRRTNSKKDNTNDKKTESI